MSDGATNAIAFMHDGELIYDAYQNGFTADTRHQLWSATKSVTSALVGIAVGEGRVESIFDPIEKYVPETVGTVWEGTTVEDLLQMESGIYWVDVPVHQPEELVLMGLDFHTNGLYGMTRNEYLLKLTRVSERGEHYRYNSADPQMLAWLLENVYDDAYSSILSEKLWQPAGMESDALIMVDREGHAFASMGLFATAKDTVRFGELFRNGGRNIEGRAGRPRSLGEGLVGLLGSDRRSPGLHVARVVRRLHRCRVRPPARERRSSPEDGWRPLRERSRGLDRAEGVGGGLPSGGRSPRRPLSTSRM